MLCIGELAKDKRKDIKFLILSVIMYIVEVTYVSNRIFEGADRSMYLTIPLIIYNILVYSINTNPRCNTRFIRKYSTAVYLMQFGIIVIIEKPFKNLSIDIAYSGWITYSFVVIIPLIIIICFKESKIVRLLF